MLIRVSTSLQFSSVREGSGLARLQWASEMRIFLSIFLVVNVVYGCGNPARVRESSHGYPVGYEERGVASWYGPGFYGNRTASGERFDKKQFTAAHRTLPIGSVVLVRSLTNGHEVTVRINDRGPFTRGRIIDLSEAAARALKMTGTGTDHVILRVTGYDGRSDPIGSLAVASLTLPAPAMSVVD
jgi:rare lipoprotein A